MEAKDLKATEHAKYLRIPPWSEITCSPCPPRGDDYDVHVKMKEHRKKGSLKIHGIFFDCDREVPIGCHVRIEIVLSEDSERFTGYGEVIAVERHGQEGPFRTKIDFRASSDEEVERIARFAGKFC